jgi:copper chaperone CopZ
VSEELLELAGVESVDVDLAAGRVTVRGEDVADAAVRTAVETAGYRVPVEQP